MTAETARPARTDWTLPGLALADLTLSRLLEIEPVLCRLLLARPLHTRSIISLHQRLLGRLLAHGGLRLLRLRCALRLELRDELVYALHLYDPRLTERNQQNDRLYAHLSTTHAFRRLRDLESLQSRRKIDLEVRR